MKKNLSYHILINADAGSVESLGKNNIEQKIIQSGLSIVSLNILPSKEFFSAMEEISTSGHPMLIGGGDGTIRSCVNYALKHNVKFGILPFGTMNLLARDLGIPCDLDRALIYYCGKIKLAYIDVGIINGEPFLCCAGIGAMPDASNFREKNRSKNEFLFLPRLVHFVMKKMSTLGRDKFYISLDGHLEKLSTPSLIISNNQYKSDTKVGADNFNRVSLKGGVLGVYSIAPETLRDQLRLMVRLFFGNWLGDKTVKSWKAKEVELLSNRHLQILSLDGETKAMEMPLKFCIKPKALAIIVSSNSSKGR